MIVCMKQKFIRISILFIIMVSLSGCEHQHSFLEATCIYPKTCTVCKETEGTALGHTWLEADCDNPKTCSICGTTEGKALGHLMEVGLCSRCNTIQNEPLLLEITSYFSSVGEATNTIGSIITSANTYSLDDVYNKLNRAQSYLSIVTSGLQDIYDLCEEYHDLRNIKNQAKHMLDIIPQKVSGNDKNSIIANLSDYANFLRQAQSVYTQLAKYIGQLTEESN